MFRTRLLVVGLVSVGLLAGSASAGLMPPILKWGPIVVAPSGGSAYYLNDTIYGGNTLSGRISYGPYEQDKNGNVVNLLGTGSAPTETAKCAVRLGDYVYFTGNTTGVYRTQVANTVAPWTTFAACTVSNGKLLETLATDGTRIYGSSTAANDQVHAYSVNPATGDLTLVWSTSGIAGRVRGMDWDASGYIYGVDGGGPTESVIGNTAHMYAISASSGAVTDMGVITFNGRAYQTVRHGSQIAVFDSFTGTGAPAGQMYVYNLSSDTALTSITPVATWDPAAIANIYGAAIDDDGFMGLTSGNGQTFGYYVLPEPGTLTLLALGMLGLTRLRRRR